jgi:hypothetical protein
MYDLAVSTGSCLGNKKTSIQNIHISMCDKKIWLYYVVSLKNLSSL